MIFILMSCFGGCGYWRRRQLMLHQQQSMIHHQQSYEQYMGGATRNVYHGGRLAVPIYPTYDTSYPAAAPSVANGGQPEGAFPAPPPYNEVSRYYPQTIAMEGPAVQNKPNIYTKISLYNLIQIFLFRFY